MTQPDNRDYPKPETPTEPSQGPSTGVTLEDTDMEPSATSQTWNIPTNKMYQKSVNR